MFRTVCVYEQVELVTARGYLCAGWARANRNQEGSIIKSCTHPADVMRSVFSRYLSDVLIRCYWSDAATFSLV